MSRCPCVQITRSPHFKGDVFFVEFDAITSMYGAAHCSSQIVKRSGEGHGDLHGCATRGYLGHSMQLPDTFAMSSHLRPQQRRQRPWR